VAEQTFDLVVLGSGPGGYTAAIRASQLGMKTAIIERELLGGICLNWGCIPTKALLRTSELFHLMHRAKEFGLKADNIGFDIEAVVKRSRAVASQLNGGVKHLMKKNNITVIEGHGKLAGSKSGSGGKLQVSKDGKVVADIAAKNIRAWKPTAS
jgi:dihydrolipoamide dehydrogenase